jgi:hypothetical protein
MRKLLRFPLLFALPLPLLGYASTLPPVLTHIPDTSCYARAGDNLAWAGGEHSEPGWVPLSSFDGDHPPDPVYWVVCDTQLDLSGLMDPSILVRAWSTFVRVQVYANGTRLGSASNETLDPATLGRNTLGLPPAIAGDLRHVALRYQIRTQTWNTAYTEPVILVGNGQALMDAEALGISRWLLYGLLPPYSIFLLILGAGLFLLGMYLYDRSQRAALWLGLYCLLAGYWRIGTFAYYLPVAPDSSVIELAFLPRALANWFPIVFIFCMAGKRLARAYWVVLAFLIWWMLTDTLCVLLPGHLGLMAYARWLRPAHRVLDWVIMFAKTAPLVAFWPWQRLRGRRLALALACVAWSIADVLWINADFFFHYHSWANPVANLCAVAALLVVALFSIFLLQDYRRLIVDRARLGSEMQAARTVQEHLVPQELPVLPEVKLDAAYAPAAEVGGDFYQVFPEPGGSTLLIIGDVSGKGLKAAMTGSVVLGALRSLVQEALSPAQILSRLNHQLAASSDGGFITCLCAHITPEGALTIANAGHLPPYRNGSEIDMPGSLPLGLNPDAQYPEATLTLAPGDTLTFLSDGVVEAQSPTGELFGFDRTRAISTQSAEQIAAAAQVFGQQDDITVLTLTFAPAGVLHA